jgi:ribonuclease P protein component
MERLKRRADFLAATTGTKVPAGPIVLQTRWRDDRGPIRVGFTVTKKTGNAVVRNRIRRRLKAAVGLVAAKLVRPGHDYVLVARAAAYDRAFAELKKDLERALQRVHHAAANPVKGKTSERG